MSSISFEVLFIFFLVIANGLFAMSEIAVVSARKVRLEQWAKRGNAKARATLKLVNSPNNFLSTVQIGITLIGILSGAIAGATIALRLETFLDSVPLFNAYSEAISIGIVVSVITYLSLVVGELVPKRLAMQNPERIACSVAGPMRTLSRITAPVVYLLSASTDWLMKLLGIRATEEDLVTEEEIKVLIEQGTQAGMFEEAEQEIVSRVFRLGDRPVKSLMTPRTSIAWLDVDSPPEEIQQEVFEHTHSRYPVGQGNLDNCLGIVRAKDLLSSYLAGQGIDLQVHLQPPLFIAENTRALKVLETFRESGTHIALVTDEYGGIEGLLTLNDLVEAIVGELPSAEHPEDPQIVQRDDGSWLVDGLLWIDELKELLEREELPSEEKGHYRTMGGLMMSFLGRVPSAGDHFEWGGFRFEVVDMDGTRVDKVLVMKLFTQVAHEATDD